MPWLRFAQTGETHNVVTVTRFVNCDQWYTLCLRVVLICNVISLAIGWSVDWLVGWLAACDVISLVGLSSERAAFISVGHHFDKFAAELGQWGATRGARSQSARLAASYNLVICAPPQL